MTESIGVIKLPISRLHMELTNICDFSCEFCPDSRMRRQRGTMSFEMAKSIIDDISRTRIARLLLFHVMGEPALHPHLVDIAEYAHAKHVDVCITTNGSRMKGDLLNALIKANIKRMIVSLQTPDESTFSMRGARGLSFEEYAEHITSIARTFIQKGGETELTVSFLSSPLRKLIIPVAKEFSIADTSKKLREYLRIWAERILRGTSIENRLSGVLKQINRVRSFKENKVVITDKLSFHTRIVGDWATHFDSKIIEARFGYCCGIQENFGILWDGAYTFCCADYEGRTSTHNYRDTSIQDYLQKEVVQKVVKGFESFRVLHPHCRQCLGDKSMLNALVKQIGSIIYFKWIKQN
ncbi:MAG: radical SAM protein [Candidatus Jettenia sp.]|nr:radical SAM/SPASM domain-containing protein [Candidatus Jettenia sp. AMX1]MBC6928755.1 radical SAM protein [Candidatus Jettenia sp.]WKZ14740.1 MAG: radical SAM protein [Candidatus Jettenia caeni]KAA0250727.1 MAG: radical SAM protein [Candidatus Jettenia sp. AMX1]MCE7880067.1 radical SAM protein [Candidatus Jettenia sp. AMX1]MCQ3926848.1 radical SAM protein [Candidatus Jettenia sp.]